LPKAPIFILKLSNKIIMAGTGLLKVIWMYALGLTLIFVGLYAIAFMSSGPTGFILMVGGLFVSMVGGIYGKKKLLEASGEQLPAIETKQIDQLKQNVVSQLKPPETAADPPQHAPVLPKPEPKQLAQPTPILPPQQIAPAVPAEGGVIKILLCPDCSTENPPTNMFCSKCGKRLRKPETAAPPSGPAVAPKAIKTGKPKSRKKAKKRAKPANSASA
jgi:hypothetical protein